MCRLLLWKIWRKSLRNNIENGVKMRVSICCGVRIFLSYPMKKRLFTKSFCVGLAENCNLKVK